MFPKTRYRIARACYEDASRVHQQKLIDTYRTDRCLHKLNEQSGHWLTQARDLLKAGCRNKCTNVVISGRSLVDAAAKCMLFKLASHIPVDNLYSETPNESKRQIFDRIARRFGRERAYVVVGSDLGDLGEYIDMGYQLEHFPIRKRENLDEVMRRIVG